MIGGIAKAVGGILGGGKSGGIGGIFKGLLGKLFGGGKGGGGILDKLKGMLGNMNPLKMLMGGAGDGGGLVQGLLGGAAKRGLM